jgi:hypothetical protein
MKTESRERCTRNKFRTGSWSANQSGISQLISQNSSGKMQVSYRNDDSMLGKLETIVATCEGLHTLFISEKCRHLANYTSLSFKSSDCNILKWLGGLSAHFHVENKAERTKSQMNVVRKNIYIKCTLVACWNDCSVGNSWLVSKAWLTMLSENHLFDKHTCSAPSLDNWAEVGAE